MLNEAWKAFLWTDQDYQWYQGLQVESSDDLHTEVWLERIIMVNVRTQQTSTSRSILVSSANNHHHNVPVLTTKQDIHEQLQSLGLVLKSKKDIDQLVLKKQHAVQQERHDRDARRRATWNTYDAQKQQHQRNDIDIDIVRHGEL